MRFFPVSEMVCMLGVTVSAMWAVKAANEYNWDQITIRLQGVNPVVSKPIQVADILDRDRNPDAEVLTR